MGRRIDDLIQNADDPVAKAMLLILQKLDVSLVAATAANERIATDVRLLTGRFDVHDNRETKDRGWLKGGVAVASVALVAILALSGYIIRDSDQKLRELSRQVVELQRDVAIARALSTKDR